MAKWENLKTAVAAVVKTNGNKEITGANMQTVLNSIINAVGNNAGFAGIATPTTNPSGIPDGPTFYIATQGGTYSYFPTDGQSTPATIQDGVISVLYNQGNGLWAVTATPMSIADGSVTTGKLATGAVTGAKIADGAVGTDHIANGAVDTAKIAEHTIRWENMDQGAVDGDILQDDAVTESKIKDGAVTEYKLGDNSVSTRSIKDGAVTTNKLYNGAVTGEKIANETITGAKLADGTVTGEKIANGTIDNEKIADSGIRTENLEDESITTNKIEDGAVTTGKIANKAVTKGKLGDDVVAILDEVDNKANIDGFYDTMGVGTARNLLGKTSVVDAFFRKIIGVGVVKGNGYVDGIKGESAAWKQYMPVLSAGVLKKAVASSTAVITYNAGVASISIDSASVSDRNRIWYDDGKPLSGHKIYFGLYAKSNTQMFTRIAHGSFISPIFNLTSNYQRIAAVTIGDIATVTFFDVMTEEPTGGTMEITNRFMIDLTVLGIDNLTTTAEVEEWLASHVGNIDYYPYNIGSLLSVKMQNVKTVGFNRWDEQWEVGGIDDSTGQNTTQSTQIRSKNYIPIISSQAYYIKTPAAATEIDAICYIYEYDSLHNFIGLVRVDGSVSLVNTTFTLSPSCRYIRFKNNRVREAVTYNHDICINFSNSGLNGTYMPYVSKTKQIPCTTLTGNHLGTRSTIFPNGMRGVGNGYDEISDNSAIVRIASVKVSELEWVDVDTSVFVANIPARKYGNGIIVICDKYASQARGVDKGIYAHTITDSVLVTDTAYQSAAAFKTAMGDATILYELYEPIEYTDLMDEQENDFSLPVGIEVEPMGTLETLPQNTEGEALTMCAPTISMQFSIDAAKILTDELPNEYRTNADDKANWQKFLAIMNDKLGGAMGGTISVDDAAVGHGLDFTFAAAQAENNRDVEPIEE